MGSGTSRGRIWWLDEMAHAGPEHLDVAYASGYDKKSPTDWSEEIAALRAFGIDSTSTVVDFGAGTGGFALAIAPYVERVVAVDVSPAMVTAMRRKGIDAVHGGFLSYEHAGSAPHAVFTRNALHHLPDFWKTIALSRIARLLKPGGVLMVKDLIFSFEVDQAETAIGSWLATAPTDSTSGWTREELAEHVRNEHSTFTWLLEAMLGGTGFTIRNRWLSPNGIYASYTCIKG